MKSVRGPIRLGFGVIIFLTSLASPAASDPVVDVTPDSQWLDVLATDATATHESENSSSGSGPDTYVVRPACSVQGNHVCQTDQLCPDGSPMLEVLRVQGDGRLEFINMHCPSDAEAPPEITSELVLRALRRIDLPKPELTIQPPGGKTLVNLDTIFHTKAEPFERALTLLGQQVRVELTPATYLWEHGDGTTQRTTTAGTAYQRGRPMSDYVTHTYNTADITVHPTVTTTWTARFQVASEPWQDVTGTVSITGEPSALRVIEATPLLVQGPR